MGSATTILCSLFFNHSFGLYLVPFICFLIQVIFSIVCVGRLKLCLLRYLKGGRNKCAISHEYALMSSVIGRSSVRIRISSRWRRVNTSKLTMWC